MNHSKDYYGKNVTLPKVGDKVLRDGHQFIVTEVTPHEDVCIIASIGMRGDAGSVEVGYYDYVKHDKLN